MNGLRKESVCQGGVSEEHLPGILQRVGAEPVWLPAVSLNLPAAAAAAFSLFLLNFVLLCIIGTLKSLSEQNGLL